MKQLTRKVKKLSDKEKLEANELKIQMIYNNGNRCEYCGELKVTEDLQLAHIVPKHEHFIKKWGYEAIHHPLNMKITCDACNSKAMNECAKSDYARTIHFKPIYDDLNRQGYEI